MMMNICEHEKTASAVVKTYLKSDLAKNHWRMFTSVGHTVNAMQEVSRFSVTKELDIIQDALGEYEPDDIVFFVDDIAPVLGSKDKSIAWNLVARSVYDFFAELDPDATLEEATEFYERG